MLENFQGWWCPKDEGQQQEYTHLPHTRTGGEGNGPINRGLQCSKSSHDIIAVLKKILTSSEGGDSSVVS